MKLFKAKSEWAGPSVLQYVLCIWLIALAVRCYGYAATPIFTDERLWIERANKVLVKLRVNPTSATTHLGQPGIPPTLLIALGQSAAKSWNSRLKLSPSDPGFIGLVDSSRIPVLLLSTLIAPLFFLLTYGIAGPGVSLVAALGLALDPFLIACSRMIHLDASLTFFVLSCLALYHFAVLRASLWLKLCAGVMWGLSIATKPTAVLLVPCFMLYRVIRALLYRRGVTLPGERRLFTWSDIGALAVGHFVFAALYTRLWVHRSEYLTRMQIKNPFASEIFSLGRWLQSNPLLTISILLVLVAAFVLSLRLLVRAWSGPRYHCVCGIFALSSAFLTILLVPQVVENLIRYWTWVFNLSHEPYRAFVSNITVNVHPHGYHELALMHLPSVVTIVALIGLWGVTRAHLWRRCPVALIPLLCVIVVLPILWGVLLGSADKQSWRYAMPVLCFVYFLAGVGLVQVTGRLIPNPRAAHLIGGMFVLWMVYLAVTSAPYHLFFRSSLSGGLSGHVARGYGIEHFVSQDTERVLFAGLHPREKPLRIMVLGDVPLQALGIKRFAPHWKDRVTFSGPGMRDADKVLGYAPFLQRLERYGPAEDFVYIDGVPMAGVVSLSD